MPPSSPLLALSIAPAGDVLPMKLKLADAVVMEPIDPENTHPNSDAASSLLSSESLLVTTQPFLEMEEVDEDDYESSHSEPVSSNQKTNIMAKDNNLLMPANPSLHKEKEEDVPDLLARLSSSALPPRVIGVSCGKRPRNSRRVSFASDAQWPTTTTAHPRRKKALLSICGTIHLNDYTLEERQASWYTLNDLRSFKRERKETARQIDNGLLPLRDYADQPDHNDIYVDTQSFSTPVEYCSRGAENCTEAMGRIRYRHICDGWRTVLNTQEKHHYLRQKQAHMSVSERNEYNALAAILGVGRKSSRAWFPYHNTSPKNTPQSSPKRSNPFENMCCPYDLAAAYLPSSEASLEIALNRAIGDECDAMAFRERDAKAAAAAAANDSVISITSADSSVVSSVGLNAPASPFKNDDLDDENKLNGEEKMVFFEGALRTMDV